MGFCAKCGFNYAEGDLFCSNCGQSTMENELPVKEAAEYVEIDIQPVETEEEMQPAPVVNVTQSKHGAIIINNTGKIPVRAKIEDSNGVIYKYEFDENGNEVYYGDSNGYWRKTTYEY